MLKRFCSSLPTTFFARAISASADDIMRKVSARFPGEMVASETIKSGESFLATNVCTTPVPGHACLYPGVTSLEELPHAEQAYLAKMSENYGAQQVKYVAKEDTHCVKGPSPSGSGTPVLYVPHQNLEMVVEQGAFSFAFVP